MMSLLPISYLLPISQAYDDASPKLKRRGVPGPLSAADDADSSLWVRYFTVLRQAKWYLLIFILIGANDGVTYTFAFIFLESTVGYSGFQLGLTLSIHALVELPLWGF